MENKENIVFYFQKKNNLFGDNVFSICYKASDEEVKVNRLTSKNALIFIKNKSFDDLDFSSSSIDRKKVIKDAFAGQSIFLRIQSECMLGMYGDSHCDCEAQRQEAIKLLKERGGIYIHLPQEALGYGIEYKFGELELQVNGRIQSGEFVGYKDKEEAQKYLMHSDEFKDIRKYSIVPSILKALGLEKNKFILITDSQRKLNEVECLGLKVEKYDDYLATHVTFENINEYLMKIIDSKYNFSDEVWEGIFEILSSGNLSESNLDVLNKLVREITDNKEFALADDKKHEILAIFNDIICGKEKKYIYSDTGKTKVRNKYSCRVSAKIFGTLKRLYGKNIFDRIAAEELYFFKNKQNGVKLKIRNSEILAIRDSSTSYLNGQIYSQQTIFSEDNERIVENELAGSRLRTYFENDAYEYVKKLQMVTFISEGQVGNMDIYIKRLPKVENRIMDIYGSKDDIREFIDALDDENVISSLKVEDEDNAKSNMIFSDYQVAKGEELHMFGILNKE